MSVTEKQMKRTRGYVNQVFELLRERAGEGFDITTYNDGTGVRIRKIDHHLHGSISFREENVWGLYSRNGNGKLYIVVNSPRHHGKIFKETKKNFEKQFERAVDFLIEDINERVEFYEQQRRITAAKDKGRKIVEEQLKGLVTNGIFSTGIHRKIEHRTTSRWNKDEPYAEVNFTLHIDGIKPEKVRETAEKIIAFMKEINQI